MTDKTKILKQFKCEFEKLADIRQGHVEEKMRPIAYNLGYEDALEALNIALELIEK